LPIQTVGGAKTDEISEGDARMSNGRNGSGPPRILVVAAHPDDETLGAGGTVARFAKQGSEVWVCLLCDGVTQRHSQVALQRQCAERACKVLGVHEVVFCDLPDQGLDTLTLTDVITPIEECVAKLRPHIVLTHFKDDVNQDHRVAFHATMVAARPGGSLRSLLCYETGSSTEWAPPFSGSVFSPNVFVDINDTLAQKVKAMSMYAHTHVSEVKPYPHPRSYEAIEVYAKRHGVVAGMGAAEPFMLVRSMI
jgi:LmbE family N-acetylglucosaminyl deacetylase